MPTAASIKTLIVDDQQTMRSLIRTSLNALGIAQTREAPDGEEALRQLIASGTQLRPFPKDVMEACYKAAMEYYAETSAKNPEFKKVYDDYKAFTDEQNSWFRVAEGAYANFMFSRKG